MMRRLALFGLAATFLAAPHAAGAQSARYGGQVFAIGKGTSAEVRRTNGYITLRVGDRVSEGDCIRLFPVGRSITIRRPDGARFPLSHDAARECTPVPRSEAGGNLVTRYINDLFSAFRRRLPPSLRAATARGAIKVAGLGDPRPRAAVAAGHRALYFNWCNFSYMQVTLSDARGNSYSTKSLTEPAMGAELPSVDLALGSWRLTFKDEQTNRSRFFLIEAVPPTYLALPPAAETPLQRLEQASALAARDRTGRFDFEALQLLSKGESDVFRDMQAREFCVAD